MEFRPACELQLPKTWYFQNTARVILEKPTGRSILARINWIWNRRDLRSTIDGLRTLKHHLLARKKVHTWQKCLRCRNWYRRYHRLTIAGLRVGDLLLLLMRKEARSRQEVQLEKQFHTCVTSHPLLPHSVIEFHLSRRCSMSRRIGTRYSNATNEDSCSWNRKLSANHWMVGGLWKTSVVEWVWLPQSNWLDRLRQRRLMFGLFSRALSCHDCLLPVTR